MINANGGKGWGTYWAHRDDPVFEPSFDGDTTYPNGDKLPGIWITEPILDDEGGYDGRTYIMVYPAPSFYDEFHPGADPDDEDGGIALHYGGCYYDEGMGYTDPADREKRVDCFRAAEVLYRHSAGRGNAIASMCLGYVYSYDRAIECNDVHVVHEVDVCLYGMSRSALCAYTLPWFSPAIEVRR